MEICEVGLDFEYDIEKWICFIIVLFFELVFVYVNGWVMKVLVRVGVCFDVCWEMFIDVFKIRGYMELMFVDNFKIWDMLGRMKVLKFLSLVL